jgi:teichuronic acid biosynthesis glycosyltransferase TuaG
MPTHNSGDFVAQTIDSVLAQTYQNWELIISDDASTDNTEDMIKTYTERDSRIKFYPSKKNHGPAVTRNRSLDKANGDYIAFLDSDDLWHAQKLEKQVHFMNHYDIAFSYTQYDYINEDGNHKAPAKNLPDAISYEGLLKNQIIGCLTVMIDKRKVGKFKMPVIRKRQDFALWLRILKKGYTANCLQEVLASYRIRKNSVSRNKFRAVAYTWRMYRDIEQLSFLQSCYFFVWYITNKLIRV